MAKVRPFQQLVLSNLRLKYLLRLCLFSCGNERLKPSNPSSLVFHSPSKLDQLQRNAAGLSGGNPTQREADLNVSSSWLKVCDETKAVCLWLTKTVYRYGKRLQLLFAFLLAV